MKKAIQKFGLLVLVCFALQTAQAQNYIIRTIAGNGTGSYSGDGGLATAAELHNPAGLAIDDSGNIYIADAFNNRIRKIEKSTGIITTIAGNGTGSYSGDGGLATAAELYKPSGIAIDDSGNIYIADVFNNRIRKIEKSTGIITTIAGNGTGNYSGDGGLATAAELYKPSGIALDDSGNIYIADTFNSRIRKIEKSTGIITTVAGNGTGSFGGDGGLATLAEIFRPMGLSVDDSDNIYIADTYNYRVRKVTKSTGIITTVAGNGTPAFSGDGGLATAAEIFRPIGAITDSAGNIFIADYGNNRIRRVDDATGIITTIAGKDSAGFGGDGGLADSAKLNHPFRVALDDSGNIYIADYTNNRVRKIFPLPGLAFTANDTTICAGDSVHFINQTSSYSPTTYQWTFQGGTPATSPVQNPVITYSAPGTYQVTLAATNANGTDSLIKFFTITINITPYVIISGNSTVQAGESDTLTATGAITYLWSTGSTADTTIVAPTQTTTYTVTGTGNNGCKGIANFVVTVPGTGIAQFKNDCNIVLYPNPANENIYISTQKEGNYTAKVYNIKGQLIITRNFDKTLDIGTHKFPMGTYIVNILNDKENLLQTQKIIVAH